MNRGWLRILRAPGGEGVLELDPTRRAEGEVVEGFLVDPDTLFVGVIAAGVAYLPPDLDAWIRAHDNVIVLTPFIDPRIVRRLRRVEGDGHDHVPFAEVVAHYRDLVAEPPAGFDASPHPDDVELRRRLAIAPVDAPVARGLVIGCGVGRAAFTLRAHADAVLGVDWSLARLRRARNIAVTEAAFHLPVPAPRAQGAPREVPLALERLARDQVDFVAADAAALPLATGAFAVVVLAPGDARGSWADPARVRAEAQRVLAPGGRLIDLGRPADA